MDEETLKVNSYNCVINFLDHSPIFAEIASSISPATSSASPSNHLNRLFNLSPSTLRNYGNVSEI